MKEYIKLFNNHQEYEDFTKTDKFVYPNVSHCIEEQDVHYSNNIESFKIFKEVFCDNINENDIEIFKNNAVFVEPYVFEQNWNNPTTYRCNITFVVGFPDPDAHWDTRINCQVNKEITEEQYNEWRNLSDDELLHAILPLFECQGEAEHTWNRPIIPS